MTCRLFRFLVMRKGCLDAAQGLLGRGLSSSGVMTAEHRRFLVPTPLDGNITAIVLVIVRSGSRKLRAILKFS
jgi:hypothetical protein